jgi:hypothetical protein
LLSVFWISGIFALSKPTHVERHVAAWQVFIHKGIFREGPAVSGGIPVGGLLGETYRLKCVVKNIHAALGEVSCVQEALAIR